MKLLLPYQQRWVSDPAALLVAEKSRRIGFTWCTAARAVLTSARSREMGGRDFWYSVATGEDDAREFITYCADWAKAIGVGCSDPDVEMIPGLYDDDASASMLAFVLRLSSGKKIHALSSNPRRLRGKQGDACYDESAHGEPGALSAFMKAATAFMMLGGRVLIMSTHNGEGHDFNKLCVAVRSGQRPGSLHRVTLKQAIREGYGKRAAGHRRQIWTPEWEREWEQGIRDYYGDHAAEELDCIPRRSGGVFLTRAEVERCTKPGEVIRIRAPDAIDSMGPAMREAWAVSVIDSRVQPEIDATIERDGTWYPYALGVDFGRVSDLSVFAPICTRRDLRRVVPFVIELQGIPYRQQEQIIEAVINGLKVRRVHMDASGNGHALAEWTQQRYGAAMVEAVKITGAWHDQAWPELRKWIQSGKLTIPADDGIVEDLLLIQNVNGVPRIPKQAKATSDGRAGGLSHGDAAVALAMAITAALETSGKVEWEPVKTGRRMPRGFL